MSYQPKPGVPEPVRKYMAALARAQMSELTAEARRERASRGGKARAAKRVKAAKE